MHELHAGRDHAGCNIQECTIPVYCSTPAHTASETVYHLAAARMSTVVAVLFLRHAPCASDRV
jgi:hypothetical protein